MNGNAGWDTDLISNLASYSYWLGIAIICCLPVFHWLKRLAHTRLTTGWPVTALNYGYIAINIGLIAVSTSLLVGTSYNPFLYFRF
jgi:alginate O-acetyltransferase complex protein AlgI